MVGAIGERGLLGVPPQIPAILDAEIVEAMEPPFRAVSTEDPVRDAVELLAGRPAGPAGHRAGRAEGLVDARRICWKHWPRERYSARRRDGFATRAVHAGLTPDPTFGSVIPAIHQTSTFAQPRPGEFVGDYDYARSANPTRTALERALGELEGGQATTFSSGLAAEHALITVVCAPGSHVVLPGRSVRRHVSAARQGHGPPGTPATTSSTRPTSPQLRAGGPATNTRLIWVETPTNPCLDVVDIEAVVARDAETPSSRSTTRSRRR